MRLTPRQKKVFAIVIISIVLPIELLFLAVMISDVVRGTPGIPENLFTMGIFAFPLWWAFHLLRTSKTKSSVAEPSSNNMVHPNDTNVVLKLNTKIELAQYRKLIYRLTYTSPAVIFFHFIGAGMLAFYLMNPHVNWFLLFILLFLLFLPLTVYRSANSNYKATKALHESITYTFEQESFTITGESFNTTMQWRSLYKISERNDWFLLYTNKQIAMLVPKSAFASLSDVETFRKLFVNTHH